MRWTALTHFFVACTLALAAADRAPAALFYNETFSYPNGNLVGQGSWTAYSSAGLKPIQVSDGKISVAQSNGSGEDIVKQTGSTMGPGSKWYAAFDVSNTGTSGQGYFAHFIVGTVNTFEDRVFITSPNTAGNDFTFALSSSASSSPAQKWPTDFAFGSTHRVVVSYDFDSRVNKLWVDPVDESSSFISTTATTSSAVNSFSFRQAAPSTPNTQVIDNLSVATTFSEALTGVPEPASLVLVTFGGAMFPLLRRRR